MHLACMPQALAKTDAFPNGRTLNDACYSGSRLLKPECAETCCSQTSSTASGSVNNLSAGGTTQNVGSIKACGDICNENNNCKSIPISVVVLPPGCSLRSLPCLLIMCVDTSTPSGWYHDLDRQTATQSWHCHLSILSCASYFMHATWVLVSVACMHVACILAGIEYSSATKACHLKSTEVPKHKPFKDFVSCARPRSHSLHFWPHFGTRCQP